MRTAVVLSLLSLLVLSGCVTAPPRPDQLSYPPLEFRLPQVERFVTENGMRIYLREDFELPLVEVTAVLEGGSFSDPADKVGLAGVFASTLRSGGAGDMTPRELDERLERMAAELSVGSDESTVTVNLSLRREDLDLGMAILADLLRRPKFDEQRFELVRSQAREGIRRRDDEPTSVASRRLREAVYGNHPLGRESTLETLDQIERSDLFSFYRRFFHPNNLRFAVSGAVTRGEFAAVLERHLGSWLKQEFTSQEIPPLNPGPASTLLVVDKDIPQTTVLMGHLGLKRSSPEFFKVRVMNFILGGGGFNSRMMREIRSDRGLAYSVYSYYTGGQVLPGMFVAGCETRNDAVLEVAEMMRALMHEMRDAPVSSGELALAKESIINSFVFAFEDSHDIVERTLHLELYGYPADYLERFRENIGAVTIADVQQAARAYLHPEGLQVVLVGDSQGFGAPPSTLGIPLRETVGNP